MFKCARSGKLYLTKAKVQTLPRCMLLFPPVNMHTIIHTAHLRVDACARQLAVVGDDAIARHCLLHRHQCIGGHLRGASSARGALSDLLQLFIQITCQPVCPCHHPSSSPAIHPSSQPHLVPQSAAAAVDHDADLAHLVDAHLAGRHAVKHLVNDLGRAEQGGQGGTGGW